jgi:hypothetical protein
MTVDGRRGCKVGTQHFTDNAFSIVLQHADDRLAGNENVIRSIQRQATSEAAQPVGRGERTGRALNHCRTCQRRFGRWIPLPSGSDVQWV